MTAIPTDPTDPADPTDPDRRAALPKCLLPAGFARAVGFQDVAPHHRYPRLRYELARDLGWKAEVEAALEKLFTVITVPASPAPVPELAGSSLSPASGPSGKRRGSGQNQAESRIIRSCASRSEKVNVPVCGSSCPSRYNRLTATSSPSAITLRKSALVSRSRSCGFDR